MANASAFFVQNQVFHNINGYLALAAAVVNFTFGLVALVRTSLKTVYITFAMLVFALMAWNFCDFMLFASGYPRFSRPLLGNPNPWFYFSGAGSAMAAAFLFHFVNAIVQTRVKNRPWIVAAYFYAILLAAYTSFASSNERVRDIYLNFWRGATWNLLFLVTLLPFILWSLVLLVRASRAALSEGERSRYRFLGTAIVITVLSGMTDLIQVFRPPIPPLGHLGSIVGPSIMAIGVLKYRQTFDVLAQARTRLSILSQMAGGLAHEIANPLGSIKGALKLLAREMDGKACGKAVEYHGIAIEEIDRLETILRDFKDFTRPIQIERQAVSVNDLLRRTMHLAGMAPMNIEVSLDLCDAPGGIQADPSLLRQVFLNLIRNAADACGPKGKLIIRTEETAAGTMVHFCDDGPGIEPGVRERLFEPFFTTKAGGMGLGLAICRRIVESHGGRIEIGPNTPRGTVVTVFLRAGTNGSSIRTGRHAPGPVHRTPDRSS